MGVQSVSAEELPQHQRDLLDAYKALLRSSMEISSPAMQMARQGPGNFAVCAIFNRLLRMGRAVEKLCRFGYADMAESTARPMVNATVDIIFLVQGETNQRALLYGLYSRDRRRRRAKSLVDHGFLRQDQADAWDAEQTKQEEKSLAKHKESGVVPIEKLGNRNTSWHGQSDEQMIKGVGRADWYDLYYVPFSDSSHANVVATRKEMEELNAGKVSIGPRFEDLPVFAVTIAAADTIATALYQLDEFFKLGQHDRIGQLQKEINSALGKYVEAIRPNLRKLPA
jgi:hypothetical protein